MNPSAVLLAPVAVPLLTAGLLVAASGHRLRLAASLLATSAVAAVGGILVVLTWNGSIVTQRVAGWPSGTAITFAADMFSALMLSVSALLVLVSLAFAASTGDVTNRAFTPLTLIMSAGVYGAFLTADLFSLFVFVEVMLMPSYVLLTMTGGGRLAAGRIYLTVNLLASTTFLAGVGLIYAVAGSVSLGDVAGIGAESAAAAVAGGVVLIALAAKAAVVPLHGWLPRTYPHAPASVAVLFSGLLTKVGVYAIIRIYAVVFAGSAEFRWLIMTAALVTMVVGVLAAIGEWSMRGILSCHMVSQIGFILLGLALFTTAGLTAMIFFLVQYVLVKATLFTCSGVIENARGTGRIDRLGGLAHDDPMLASAFAVAAFSLAGLPPLSGFVGKLALIRAAALEAGYLAMAIAVTVSLFTLMSMIKIWGGVFWGQRRSAAAEAITGAYRPGALRPGAARLALTVPALLLAVPSVVLGIAAQPLLEAAATAANELVDTSAYVRAVAP